MVQSIPQLEKECRVTRKEVLRMIARAGTSHIGSNLSAVEIGVVLNHLVGENDEVVWSPGWKAALIYYLLHKRGVLPKDAITKFPEPPYLGLAETEVPGVLCNGGSVGHGASVATGVAYAKHKLGQPGHVWCVLSDGELNEGSTWEAFMFAGHHQLNQLTFVVDMNGIQAMGDTHNILNPESLRKKAQAFRLSFSEVEDGNDIVAVKKILSSKVKEEPRFIQVWTTKGKGVSFMENDVAWHYRNVTEEDLERALAELDHD